MLNLNSVFLEGVVALFQTDFARGLKCVRERRLALFDRRICAVYGSGYLPAGLLHNRRLIARRLAFARLLANEP